MSRSAGPSRRWSGSKALLFDAIDETTKLVERMHISAANRSMRPFALAGSLAAPAHAVHGIHAATASTVYAAVRLTSRGVETLLDARAGTAGDVDLLDDERAEEAAPLRSDAAGSRAWLFDHAEAHVNGLYGDYLSRQGNSLDLGMTLRADGRVLPVTRENLARIHPNATGRLCVFVHGLFCTEWSWSIAADEFYGDPGATFGASLQDELGYTPLYVRYNSGRHISENGRALSALLAEVVSAYPTAVEEIVLMGHSMGGLIVRSAAHYGQTTGEAWAEKLNAVFCIGAPTLGAPLEQAIGLLGGLLSAIDTVGTQAPAQLLKTRSAGIKDLRHGYTIDEEWQGRAEDAPLANHRRKMPLVDGVGYYFIAATATENPNHPVGLLLGDLLVRLPSAKGEAAHPARQVEFHAGRVFTGINHFHLANHPEVYGVVKELLTENHYQ